MVRLKESEWHHFENYRNILFDVVNNIELTDKSIEDAYRSDILPELTKMQILIDKNRQSSGRTIIDNV
jgi:hypothetical protein